MGGGTCAAKRLPEPFNWGFRLPSVKMDEAERAEISNEFDPWINQLQYRGQGSREGRVFDSYGIVYVPDPYSLEAE